MQIQKSIGAAFILILTMIACNLQAEQLPPPPEAQTAAALTVQAILTISLTPTEPQAIIAITASPGSATPTITPAVKTTITLTYSVPMLTVQQQTNCHTGPGQDYEVIFTYLPGKKLEIIGRFDPDNYWLVKSAESPTGTCWLWGEYVEVVGSYWVVPSVTPPPTATLAPPQAPSLQKWDFFCSNADETLTITIQWTDRANNEIGYRVFRDGEQIAELPADSNTYTESTSVKAGESAEYYVQVYNSTGTASSSIVKVTC